VSVNKYYIDVKNQFHRDLLIPCKLHLLYNDNVSDNDTSVVFIAHTNGQLDL